jgi:uncharacterized DUF497 family protein
MQYDWDPAKHEKNMRERKIGFHHAADALADVVMEFEDMRKPYGEKRMVAVCRLDGRLMIVVYTKRAPNLIHIISARKANKREIRKYLSEERT